MSVDRIVQQLKQERDRLDTAIAALGGISGAGYLRRGRPAGSKTKGTSGRRQMSAAGRKRIADAMKARWAAVKKSGRNRLVIPGH